MSTTLASTYSARTSTWAGGWPVERVLFAMAGTITLISALLAVTVTPWFLLLTAFVGVNQLLYSAFGFCGASLVIGRFTKLEPACAKGESR
jgi:hypothetical protein